MPAKILSFFYRFFKFFAAFSTRRSKQLVIVDLSLNDMLRAARARGPGFDTRFGHILSFLLPLNIEGQFSVTGESMCTKY